MPVMTAEPLAMSRSDRRELERLARSTSLPHRTVRQAKALLWAADGVANDEIARRCEVDADTVRRWRQRFEDRRLGRGGDCQRPRAQVLAARGHRRRGGETYQHDDTAGRLDAMVDAYDGDLHRASARTPWPGIWRDHNLKPWRVDDLQAVERPSTSRRSSSTSSAST